ncbi:MAG: VWA domain-containing protein [Pseudomonadota bacterium]
MTDELDDLKAAMTAATPAPDPDKKAANLALARKKFETLQGSRNQARPRSERPMTGLWTGARKMIDILSTRAGLTATTALVAGAFVVLTPLGDRLLMPPAPEPVISDPAPRTQEKAESEVFADAELREPDECGDGCASFDEPMVEAPVIVEEFAAAEPARKRASGLARFAADSTLSTAAPLGQPQAAIASPSDLVVQPESNTEAFANKDSNPLKITVDDPVSTFSIDVDTASYTVVRNSLMNGFRPDADAVRIEEMINYFPYDYPWPEGDAAFQPTVSVIETPWNTDTQLVHIGIQGAMPDIEDRPPLDLVFLIDTSGSMNSANKLPLLKQSFALMLGQLRPEDQVAIVTYAGSAGQVLDPTPASDRKTIMAALNRLGAGGSTAGQEGLQQAYATAAGMAEDGRVSRVILATDGDFNVGISDPDQLKEFIANNRDSGTYLSVLGFGRGNLDDATMQALAQNGNGQAAYIDTLNEAQKVLVDQLTGALFPIADDVKIQVEFNPANVAEYRLIGYETRALRREDFNNDKVDAGDIGAGHSVTAIYEVTPVGSPAQLTDPLRYEAASEPAATSDELGYVRLRYKAPGDDTSQLIEQPIGQVVSSDSEARFAAAIAGFGQLLRDPKYLGDWGYEDAITLANANRGDDAFGYRTEAVQLMRLAQSLGDR